MPNIVLTNLLGSIVKDANVPALIHIFGQWLQAVEKCVTRVEISSNNV